MTKGRKRWTNKIVQYMLGFLQEFEMPLKQNTELSKLLLPAPPRRSNSRILAHPLTKLHTSFVHLHEEEPRLLHCGEVVAEQRQVPQWRQLAQRRWRHRSYLSARTYDGDIESKTRHLTRLNVNRSVDEALNNFFFSFLSITLPRFCQTL